MSRRKNRNVVRYNNQLLYFAFDADDFFFNDNHQEDPTGELRNIPFYECNGNRVRQLHRVQALNYNINTNLLNLNQFGQLGRYDGAMAENPDVTVDFEYVLSDGYNENVMGFVLDGQHQALSKILTAPNKNGSNIYIAVAPNGHNIGGANLSYFGNTLDVIGVGNSFLSQYAVIAEVGNVPRARVSFDAFNINSSKGYFNLPSPSLDMAKECISDKKFSLPDTYENFLYPKLKSLDQIEYHNLSSGVRPSDIKIYLEDAAVMTKLFDSPNSFIDGAANIQGFTINLAVGTTKINQLGSVLGFTRTLNLPARIEVEVNAIVAELKESPNIVKYLECGDKKFNIILDLLDCRSLQFCQGDLENRTSSMRFVIKNAEQISESFSSNIGDSKTVNIKFTASLASIDDEHNGLFIYAKSFFPDRPRVLSWGKPL